MQNRLHIFFHKQNKQNFPIYLDILYRSRTTGVVILALGFDRVSDEVMVKYGLGKFQAVADKMKVVEKETNGEKV